ncbi:MAG: alpha/beta fold hydrolase [Gammaproteobacteria bacterium]|nr:alpha/beta fold hydrolase [Gammaproteobacteria bacterium]
MSRGALVVAILAALLIGGALYQLDRANAGVVTSTTRLGATPVTVFRAQDTSADQPRPVIVIAHGFAGSQQLMQPFAVTLAKNGYLAVTFDYYGHGRNHAALAGDITRVEGATISLLQQTREVVDYALSLPGASGDLASLGHSMASDIMVRYAAIDARVDATIAVSMFSPAVTAENPRNLLVVVGGLERFLQQEALRVLGMVTDTPQEGITVGAFDNGSARRVAFADGVEHVGVLYSSESMREAVAWLDRVYGRNGGGYVDERGFALVALIIGIGLLTWPLSKLLPVVSRPARGASLRWRQLLPAASIPAIGTPLLLWWFPADFLGVLVGGYLAIHFLVYGLLTAACLYWIGRSETGTPVTASSYPRLAVASLLATLYVAGLIALVLDTYVTSFAITPPRVPLLFLMLVGTLCYFVADEWLTHGAKTARGGHLFTRICFLVSLGLAVALSFEDLFFLLIIAGVIVIYFLVYGLFSKWIYLATGHPAVGALANAVAFAWALAAVFPMLS